MKTITIEDVLKRFAAEEANLAYRNSDIVTDVQQLAASAKQRKLISKLEQFFDVIAFCYGEKAVDKARKSYSDWLSVFKESYQS